ncbi:MAG: 6-phosphogluconolactonase [Desulfobacterales bacterium]|nr:MAG: 6-phosphogluconolactonase [Desulfobacterales bacterium]
MSRSIAEQDMLAQEEIIVKMDAVQLAQTGAEIFCQAAGTSIARHGFFAVALSGGSTPRAMHRLLARQPAVAQIRWTHTHIFWVDERMVPYDHPDSNFGAAQADFLTRVPIPPQNIHPMPVRGEPATEALRYQAELKAFFQAAGRTAPVFDLIFLGIGVDGHTASLFPGQAPSARVDQWVRTAKGGKPDVWRLTLTYPAINLAGHIVFLVSGEDKAPILEAVFGDRRAQLPAQKIRPSNGKLTWLLDQAAARSHPKQPRKANRHPSASITTGSKTS